MKKKCTKCKKLKLLTEFCKDKNRKDGLSGYCSACRKVMLKQYRDKDPEKARERCRQYYAQNRTKQRERGKKYQEQNREKCREDSQKYKAANRKKIREYNREYKEVNRERVSESRRKYGEANREKIREASRQYKKANRERVSAYSKQYRAKNPEKVKAHHAVYRALQKGTLTKPTACVKCDRSDLRIASHHEDYSKPLEVDWLCASCHQRLHAEVSKKTKGEQHDRT